MRAIELDCRHCDAQATKEDVDWHTANEMAAGHSWSNPGHSVQVREVVE